MCKKILIVEDDKDITQTLEIYLTESGFMCECAQDGMDAIRKFETNHYACILLDLMIPKMNGIEVLNVIRKTSQVPIIIVSAKDTDFDIAVALDLGADDYVTKPFSLIELTARIRTCIRRSSHTSMSTQQDAVLKHGALVMDLVTHDVSIDSKPIKLTNTEFEILKLFMNHTKRVFTKEDIYKTVWEEAYFGDENIVNVHMSRLREKIEKDPKQPQYIETLWGIGYRMKAEGNSL